jgi:hypothetical protein
MEILNVLSVLFSGICAGISIYCFRNYRKPLEADRFDKALQDLERRWSMMVTEWEDVQDRMSSLYQRNYGLLRRKKEAEKQQAGTSLPESGDSSAGLLSQPALQRAEIMRRARSNGMIR